MKNAAGLLFFVFLMMNIRICRADEGMWIPLLLPGMTIEKMHQAGLQLDAEQIYSVNHSSLKDAVVQFGRGCTGEVVSPEGLLLTNHHCGYGMIQYHSSLDHDYLTDGFWALSKEKELPCPGLTVTFLVRIEEVTDSVLAGITEMMSEKEREEGIRKKVASIVMRAVGNSHYEAAVKPFFSGNQFFLFVTETFSDIRFVGAPPSAIGKFGGDTDNWMWPRHTGDFSVFRIYAGKDNKPAKYSPGNIPYKPAYWLPVSLKGYHEGDFTLLYGYPGSTREYLPSFAVKMIAEKENPVKIGLRKIRLDIISDAMLKDPLIRIQYASKHAGIANYWKKMIGESRGVRRYNAVEKKREMEKQFLEWLETDTYAMQKYRNLLPEYARVIEELYPLNLAMIYLTDAGMSPELIRMAISYKKLTGDCMKKTPDSGLINEEVIRRQEAVNGFYKNYQAKVDQKIMTEMLSEMRDNLNPGYLPDAFAIIEKKFNGNVEDYVGTVYRQTIFSDSSKLKRFLDGFSCRDIRKIERDPAFILASGIYKVYDEVLTPERETLLREADSLQRIYMFARMKMSPEKNYFPDANFTPRVSFGKVTGYSPSDAVKYDYFTTAEGILEKEDSLIADYSVTGRLKELILAGDYGRYANEDGSLTVAFIASNHSTGGNSGAPVMNGEGHLIGLNFDRNWEGTMSDLMYNPDQCRNIVLDIRYLLFIMDRYAGAQRLIDEMTIIQ